MSEVQRPVMVFGATGRQGGSVAAALLKAHWPVRVFVQNPLSLQLLHYGRLLPNLSMVHWMKKLTTCSQQHPG